MLWHELSLNSQFDVTVKHISHYTLNRLVHNKYNYYDKCYNYNKCNYYDKRNYYNKCYYYDKCSNYNKCYYDSECNYYNKCYNYND